MLPSGSNTPNDRKFVRGFLEAMRKNKAKAKRNEEREQKRAANAEKRRQRKYLAEVNTHQRRFLRTAKEYDQKAREEVQEAEQLYKNCRNCVNEMQEVLRTGDVGMYNTLSDIFQTNAKLYGRRVSEAMLFRTGAETLRTSVEEWRERINPDAATLPTDPPPLVRCEEGLGPVPGSSPLPTLPIPTTPTGVGGTPLTTAERIAGIFSDNAPPLPHEGGGSQSLAGPVPRHWTVVGE